MRYPHTDFRRHQATGWMLVDNVPAGSRVSSDAIQNAYTIAICFVFLMSMFNSLYLISSMTVLQMRVPDALRGRVMGIHGITFSLIPLGALFGGSIASAFTPPIAVAVGASIVMLAVLSVATTQREIRNLKGE